LSGSPNPTQRDWIDYSNVALGGSLIFTAEQIATDNLVPKLAVFGIMGHLLQQCSTKITNTTRTMKRFAP
jgi:hypothetical protein